MARQQITDRQKKITYSTTEQLTGDVWIDGKPIYRKTVSIGALPDSTTKDVSHGISDLSAVIDIRGWAVNNTPTWLSLPYSNPTAASSVACFANSTQINIVTGSNRTSYATCYVTLWYTKT